MKNIYINDYWGKHGADFIAIDIHSNVDFFEYDTVSVYLVGKPAGSLPELIGSVGIHKEETFWYNPKDDKGEVFVHRNKVRAVVRPPLLKQGINQIFLKIRTADEKIIYSDPVDFSVTRRFL